MKNLLVLITIIISNTTFADVQKPNLCTSYDFAIANEAFLEMKANGVENELYNRRIGTIVGDCFNHYSLEDSAKRRHKMDMPPPACGIIFVLEPENQKQQATWILENIGKSFATASGGEIAICSKVSTIGPFPGATVHN